MHRWPTGRSAKKRSLAESPLTAMSLRAHDSGVRLGSKKLAFKKYLLAHRKLPKSDAPVSLIRGD